MNRLCYSLTSATVLLAFSNCSSHPPPADPWHSTPSDVKFVAEDVSRFWQAYDQFSVQTTTAERVATLKRAYFDGGSAGLTSYARDFMVTPELLLAAVTRYDSYYQRIREASMTFPNSTDEQEMRRVLENFEGLYPRAHYPDVYFVIGDTQTGGTITSEGLVLGTETMARDPLDTQSTTPPHLIDLQYSREKLPLVVAHELAHAQQSFYSGKQTVLFWIILEGVAEFICELLTGTPTSAAVHAYGDAHEAELWAELQATKDDLGKGNWFTSAEGERPTSIGYYVGYRIVKSYYETQAQPAQAVEDMLNIEDYDKFLQDSGYASRFE